MTHDSLIHTKETGQRLSRTTKEMVFNARLYAVITTTGGIGTLVWPNHGLQWVALAAAFLWAAQIIAQLYYLAGRALLDHQSILQISQTMELRMIEAMAYNAAVEAQLALHAESAAGAPPKGQIVEPPASPLSMSAVARS